MAATFAGLGFGNAGVHIPHANAYPIAGRVRDYRPEGYPADEAIVPHGMAVSLTAPEAFRFTFDAAPERHLRAARLLDPDGGRRGDGPDVLPGVLVRADARHRHPQRPRRGRATARPTSTTWSPARSSSSGCWPPPPRPPPTTTSPASSAPPWTHW